MAAYRYADTPAGWLRASRDRWDASLARYGHTIRWRRSGTPSRDSDAYYHARCRRCGFEMRAGHGWQEFRLRPATFLDRLLVRSLWTAGTAVPLCPGVAKMNIAARTGRCR